MDRSSSDRRLGTNASQERRSLVSRSFELGDVSFGAVLEAADRPRVQWATPDGLEVVGCGVAARLTATGPDRFSTIRARADRTFDALDHDGPEESRPRAFGGLSFHDTHEPNWPWEGFDAASFVVPQIQITRDDGGTWLTVTDDDADTVADVVEHWREQLTALPAMRPSGTGPGIVTSRQTTTHEEWTQGVQQALDQIDRGGLEKVVLAQALSAELEGPIDVPATLERLRRQYPNCYRFLIDPGEGGTFFGAPPERLVSKHGRSIETEALAGSVSRGETREEDESLVEQMRESEKVQHEHGLVVETIRDQLTPLGEVTIGEQTVRRLATIQHLQTPIRATLTDDRHVLEIADALHPTPAVGGLPPALAWETIRRLETFDRGWYAAPVGWFDAAGDGEFAVAIRSGIATDETVTLFAGNGIVADSNPDDEWKEVQLKFRPILDELR